MRQAYQLEWASKDLGQQAMVALGDVNGDGMINIVAGTSAVSGSSSLYVFQYRGSTYHQLARASLGDNDTHCIKVLDIDRDGRDEIIIGCTRGILIYKMRGPSLVKIAEATDLGGPVASIAIADIDKDGRYEIIVTVKKKPQVFIYRYDGSLALWKREVFEYEVYCVAVGDTDGCGYPEVVIKTHAPRGCMIYVISFKSGSRIERWRSHFHEGDRAFLVVADFDRDGKHEIVFDCNQNRVKILCYRRNTYEVFWDSPTLPQNPRDVAVYDIDGNGQQELVIVCLNTVYIYGWTGGRVTKEWTQTVPNGAFCVAAGELNQRGYGEIVVGTVYGYIYVIEARRDKERGKLWVGKIQAIIQDTVTIPAGKPDAERGVEAKAKFSIDEVKVIHDKVIVDGEVTAKILYVAAIPSQPVHFFQATFPFLEFIHLYGAEPGMEALVYFNVEHINVDAVGPRSIKITILFEMLVKLVPFCWDP